jgi:hypothetical protein
MTKEIIFRVLARNCKKALLHLLHMFWGILNTNLSHFSNISSEEIDFEVWNCKKSSVIWRSRNVQSLDQKKLLLKDRHTTVSWSVKNLSSIWYTVWEEIDFAVWKRSSCHDTVPIGVMVKNNLWYTFSQDKG